MLKLSKTQKEIEVLAGRVPQLNDSQREWARKHFNYFRVVRQGTTEIRCPDCKCVVPLADKKKGSKWCKDDSTITCPHCGATIQIRAYADVNPKFNNKQEDFFEVMNVVGDWQVTRLFFMRRYCYVRRDNTPWEFYEVCQAWNNPAYPTTYFRAYPKTCMCTYHFNPYKLLEWFPMKDEQGNYLKDEKGYYIDCWKPCELEPRRVGGANYFETNAIAPGAKILPYYKQRGFTRGRLQATKNAMWLFECFSNKHYKPMYETLMKADEWDVFDKVTTKFNRENGRDEKYFSAWKVCQRNHYSYQGEKSEWIDLVTMLIEDNKDYRNPHYVCPASIHEMHQFLLDIKHQQERKAQREKEKKALLENIKTYGETYAKRIAKYLNMDIHDDTLTIVVLPDIGAFYEEGLHMCHCVYRCGYYRHDDSLILSARDKTGKRWETIEVSLRDFTIVQSYGYGDRHTEKHTQIKHLVESNMWQIRDRYRKAS